MWRRGHVSCSLESLPANAVSQGRREKDVPVFLRKLEVYAVTFQKILEPTRQRILYVKWDTHTYTHTYMYIYTHIYI